MSEEQRKEYCGRCDAATPLDVGLNQAALDMDWDIAHEVFDIPEEALISLEAVNIALPAYSTDRAAANRAMTAVWAKGGGVRARLDAELARCAKLDKLTSAEFRGLSTAIIVLTPDRICEAVLTTVRACREAKWFANTRDGHRAFHEIENRDSR